MTVVVFVVVGLALLALVVATGNRTLRNHDGRGQGVADALGSFIDIFDPARAKADLELASRRHQGGLSPTPDDDDRPVRVDLHRGTARVRRP